MAMMHKQDILSFEKASRIIRANFETGELYWEERTPDMFEPGVFSAEHKCNKWNSRHAGKLAGTRNPNGYVYVKIFNIPFRAHRVIWLLHAGAWPTTQIDHVNGDKSDNRPSNLREASPRENTRNQCRPRSNTSGVLGVYKCRQNNRWYAQIKTEGKSRHLGYFSNKDDAIAARKRAEISECFHPNHGRG